MDKHHHCKIFQNRFPVTKCDLDNNLKLRLPGLLEITSFIPICMLDRSKNQRKKVVKWNKSRKNVTVKNRGNLAKKLTVFHNIEGGA